MSEKSSMTFQAKIQISRHKLPALIAWELDLAALIDQLGDLFTCIYVHGLIKVNHLTLKWLGHFFQYEILFPNVVQQMCNIFIWNWSNILNV